MLSLPQNSPSGSERESDEADLVRLYNCSTTALTVLYEAATGGSSAAREKLHQLADILVDAAGRYARTGLSEVKR